MARISEHHETLTNGVGKCSVPMWIGGAPGGFCDQPAFGERPPGVTKTRWDGYEYRDDGRYPGYVPALACPVHGGPRLVTQQDGNAWMAALPGFTNVQECETGWGDTEETAVADLLAKLTNGVGEVGRG
jgi:hypothetical protein